MKRALFILLFTLMLFPLKGFAGKTLSNDYLKKNEIEIVQKTSFDQENAKKYIIPVRVILVDPETNEAYAWCDGYLSSTPDGVMVVVLVECYPM